MPSTRQYLRRPQRAALNGLQLQELWLGVCGQSSVFRSDAERRAAWFRHRDRIMRQWGRGGRRPMGWWLYEASERGLRYPTDQYERSVLWEAGVLSEEERSQLEAKWRREWERCWNEFTGDEARVHHLMWADVPPELVYKWLDEREQALVA